MPSTRPNKRLELARQVCRAKTKELLEVDEYGACLPREVENRLKVTSRRLVGSMNEVEQMRTAVRRQIPFWMEARMMLACYYGLKKKKKTKKLPLRAIPQLMGGPEGRPRGGQNFLYSSGGAGEG